MNHTRKKKFPKKKAGKLELFLRKYMDIIFAITFILLIVLETKTHNCDTLLPICIPWMYGNVAIFYICIILASVKIVFFKSSCDMMDTVSYFVITGMLAYMLIPAIVLLPNRYIHSGKEKICYGVIVDNTSMPLNKCPDSMRNYVKIKLCSEKTCFWHNTFKETKPVGTKCILKIRTGFFGLRYAQEVDFIVQ